MSPDLSTRYLGFSLRSPLVASASPLTGDLEVLRRLEDLGVGAVVLPSLFEEQIEHEEAELLRLAEVGAHSYGEALDYFPKLQHYNSGPDAYLAKIAEARRALSIPVVASLNGASRGGWVHYARRMEEAGASALELNVYWVPVHPAESGAEVEQRYLDLVSAVRAAVRIPLAVKTACVFSSPAHMALRLEAAGADGLVLFNRLLRPDLDLEKLELVPRLELSESPESRLPLLWIGVLREHVRLTLAATSGVHSASDALKLLLVGADVVMATSSLLRHGPGHARTLLEGLSAWMREREYTSVAQLRGSMSRANCPDPTAYERANYMRTLVNYATPTP
ncbi:MAG: dihydroorotate dehydrogenase-like protein [Planctomycetes bacterium]|nr:dihydroorotate dehydrogenase-like protein [Planctomycetota bacterium]